MSFNIMYLDKNKFITLYENNDLDKLYKVDSFILEDKKSIKYLKLFKKNKMGKLKKILSKNVKKNI